MTLSHNPKIVSSGLFLLIDPVNIKSYPGTGGTATDIVGGRTVTVASGTTYSNGFWSSTGATTIDCGSVPAIGPALTGFSIDIWVNPNAKAVRCIAENGSNYLTNSFYLFQENATTFTFNVSNGTNYNVAYANFEYFPNTWYNLVGTWASGQFVKLYSNGVDCTGSGAGIALAAIKTGDTNLFLGSRSGVTHQFNGLMGRAAFYDKALTLNEVKQNFEASRIRYGI